MKKRIKELNEAKTFLKSLKIKVNKDENTSNKENEEIIEEKKEINDNNNIDLTDDDIIKIIEAMLYNIDINEIKNKEKIYINEVENYLMEKEKEGKLNEIINIINLLKEEDKEKILSIMKNILDNNNECIKVLNEKIDIKNENIQKLVEEYKKESEVKELKEDKLAELTIEIMCNLMKEYNYNENDKKMEVINKAANKILNLNKNDQIKILDVLNDIKKNEYQKQNFDILNNLIENLNFMRLYLFSVNQNQLLNNDKDNNMSSTQINKLKNSIINDIDINKNVDKMALRLSTFSINEQNDILNEINNNAYEFSDNKRKSLDKLNQLIKSVRLINAFTSVIKKNRKSEKIKISDDKIMEISYNISSVLTKEKNPKNFTEKLLIDKNKEQKIEQLANSINIFDEESKRKTISFLNKNAINDKQKKNINKLKNELTTKNDKNLLSSQYYMIKTLGITDLNETELNILIEAFSKDLFNHDLIQDNSKNEENMNLIANLIKELDEENQIKILDGLEDVKEADENIIKDLRDRVLRLNLLKDELREEKEEEKEEIIKKGGYDEELIENIEEENNEDDNDNDKTVTVEITIDDIEEEDIKEICQVFKVNYDDEKEKKNLKKSINLLASSLIKLNDESQKKITNKLEQNINNNDEKNQLKELMEQITKINIYKELANKIKEKRDKIKNDFDAKIKNILELNENRNKNLEKNDLNNLINEIIKDLFMEINEDFNKNEVIRKYIIKAINEKNIWISAKKIDALSLEDKEYILKLIRQKSEEENKLFIYNKLSKLLSILDKVKEMKNKIESKKNELIDIDGINLKESEEKLESLIKKLNKEESIDKDDIINIVDEIIKLDDNNQKFFLNKCKEKITKDKKEFIIKQIELILNKKKNHKNFVYKVLEKYLTKLILEKEKDEKKYGIFIEENDKRGTLILKKPKELNENNFNEMKNNFINDLNKIKKESEDSNIEISCLELYMKNKIKEKKLEEIADIINSLDDDDKNKIIEEIKKNFDDDKENNLYNELMNIIEKREKKYNEEKRVKKKETIKEIEEQKDNEENNLLYSIIADKNENANNNSFDIVNVGEYYIDDYNNNINNEQNKENNEVNIFTFKKGYLETEEIY